MGVVSTSSTTRVLVSTGSTTGFWSRQARPPGSGLDGLDRRGWSVRVVPVFRVRVHLGQLVAAPLGGGPLGVVHLGTVRPGPGVVARVGGGLRLGVARRGHRWVPSEVGPRLVVVLPAATEVM